jgi:D-glycero-D-manno-heptose 1,7-bisphosphate phosphatase
MTGGAAVFLDRDGVLNRPRVIKGRPHPPASLAEFELLPGVPEACRDLHEAGYLLIVVTNQPDIARGTLTPALIDAFHDQLRARVHVDDIRVCPHDDADHCGCRKPAPGLLTGAAADHDIDLTTSFMVGDRWRDIEAGRQAGCRTVLIHHQWAERPADRPDMVVGDLTSAAGWILGGAARRETA